jgi:hypothetical protein
MSLLERLLAWPAVYHLALALMHFLWQGTLVAVALAGILFCLRRRSAQARYLSGCIAFTVMALLPLLTLAISQKSQTAKERDEPAIGTASASRPNH